MDGKIIKITAAFVVTALATPVVLADSPGREVPGQVNVQEEDEDNQFSGDIRTAEEESDTRKQDQAEEAACGSD